MIRAYSFDSGQHLHEKQNKSVNKLNLSYSPGIVKGRKKYSSFDSEHAKDINDPWGWFEDFESPQFRSMSKSNRNADCDWDSFHQPLQKALSLPPPVTETPLYILESNLETQQLWYSTAGRRPKQPVHEREYFERLWQQNFEVSSVKYEESVTDFKSDLPHLPSSEAMTNTIGNSSSPMKPKSKSSDKIHVSEFDGEVVFRGKAPFSHSVSKSFNDHYVSCMTIHIPYYRIFRSSANSALRAEFLVVVSMGSPSTVTFGLWRRHSDFAALAASLREPTTATLATVTGAESGKMQDTFKNTLLSWDCVLQRKRWFKCLDKDYLSLKSFLLERFMHDLLFESSSPQIINKFLGLDKGKKI